MNDKKGESILGIIGGSGLYDVDGLTNTSWKTIDTSFGPPSDSLLHGEFQGQKVVFLPRHGRGHRISPTGLNFRANIEALKKRLLNRHQGQEKLIEQRMNKFNEEISHWNEYDYVVVNDDLEICYNKILEIITSEKKGISQKKNLDEIAKKVEELTE